jgi:hypothetical protein
MAAVVAHHTDSALAAAKLAKMDTMSENEGDVDVSGEGEPNRQYGSIAPTQL